MLSAGASKAQCTPWEFATDGRAAGRWDDPAGVWRALYVGSTRLACYLEVLAFARPSVEVLGGLDEIVVDAEDASEFPAVSGFGPGHLPMGQHALRPAGAPVSGIVFDSRHGDGFTLCAVYEHLGDEAISSSFPILSSTGMDAAATLRRFTVPDAGRRGGRVITATPAAGSDVCSWQWHVRPARDHLFAPRREREAPRL